MVNVKETKMMISSENAEKVAMEGKFPCTFCRKLAVIQRYASFSGVGCIKEVVILEVN